VGAEADEKMKANFFNSIISVLLVLLIIPGIIPVVASAADGELGDSGNSTNSTLSPDLTIGKLYTDPKVPRPNNDVTIYALVKNTGNAASESTSLIYTIDGAEQIKNVPIIMAGSEVLISHIWKTSDKGGTVTITAVLENVKNSQKKISVIVENPFPDLIIENIVPEPANPQEGEPLNFTVKVKNKGSAPSGEALANYSINGIAGQDINIPPLSAGASINLAFSLTPEEVQGTQMEVQVTADSGNTVLESNEGNNGLKKTVNLKGLPSDLTIESISLSPETPGIGEIVTFTVAIKNNGPGASSSNALKYTITGTNETYSGKVSVPLLAAGETVQPAFSWTPGNEGNIEINTQVDADAVVPESNEENNQLTKTAIVTKEPASTGGGGGGGGGSGGMGSSLSKEPAKNVAAKELATRNVVSGNHIIYDFPKNNTCIVYIEYDAERTLLRTTTTVEELKNKSVFVPELPSGRVYKHVNIWVGDKRGGLPTSLKNGLVGFRVEKEWIKNNNVNESLVTLQWYNNNSWEPSYTEKVGEDNTHVFFKSETPGYSFFAITEYTGEVNKNEIQVGSILQDTLRNLGGTGDISLNESAKISKAKEVREAAKILMAISLPIFLIFVGYLVVKKKI